jgi:alkanesulfonate monooxygenase SsuD/methylene tetrahydromethanopterin reductase-like flavin-dependent oxidoreductase (luciferase family)
MTAKMTATLDQISGGRLIHFFDGGNNRREHVAYGLPWSEEAEERIARMGESLELTLALWTAHEAVTYRGRFYHVEGARCRPAPVQRPHPPVWLGEAHPAMLELCARHAQGWNTTPVPLPELDRRLAALHAACAQAGRPYEELEKSFETQVLIAPDRAGLRRALERILARGAAPPDPAIAAYARGDEDRVPTSLDQAFLIGTPDEVDARIRTYLERGISHFLLWFMDAPETEGLELFATEVAPRFR